jgi:hypothetical protein
MLLQVATVLQITAGQAVTQVANPSREPVTVTLALWRSLADTTAPAALVSPAAFLLESSATQTVRIRAREACGPAWRWVATLTPLAAGPARGATLTLVSRLVAKVSCR